MHPGDIARVPRLALLFILGSPTLAKVRDKPPGLHYLSWLIRIGWTASFKAHENQNTMTTTQIPILVGSDRAERHSAARVWAGLSTASKRLVAVGAGFLLVMVVAVGLTIYDMRSTSLEDTKQNTSKLGIAIAEQTSRSYQAIELALDDLIKDFRADNITTQEQFRTLLRNEALHNTLHQRDLMLPQASAFTIIGADGRLVNFSRTWPIPVTDLSDRDYYRYFLEHDDPRPFLSKPVQNRGDGGWTMYIVKRVNNPQGQFLGLVLGAVELDYFRDFYRALTVGAGTTVTLLEKDGTALTGFPATQKIGEVLPAASKWHALVAEGKPAAFETIGVLAPGLRIVSVHPLAEYGLVVNVSVNQYDALAKWRKAAALAGIGTLSAVLCVLLLLRALMQQLQRLERSESSLADQNTRLESARRRMESQAEELQSSRQHLAEKSTALATTLDHMGQGIMMIDGNRHVAVCNNRAMQMLDLPAELMAAHPTLDDVVAYQHAIDEFRDRTTPQGVGTATILTQPATYERRRPNGRILEIQSVPLISGGMVRTYTDVTERRAIEEKIRYFAHHDDLTKLVNRVVFQQRLDEAIDLAERTGRSVAILYLDLDRFKLVNDTKGHAAGDALLVQAAARLRAAVRDVDTVARVGGDEFAIIQPMVESPEAAVALAERVLDLVRAPFSIDGARSTVGVSIGIALYPDHATNGADLLRHADTALYRAKSEGRGVACMFQPEMDARQQSLFQLEQELREAVQRGQFTLDYQPIVDAATRRTVCFEALVRWQHPVRGLIAPGEFIGIAEKSGLIVPIGLWVLRTACREAASWPRHLQIAVNLSPTQFSQDTLVEELKVILAETGLDPSRLTLEVTEDVLLEETSVVLSTMQRLHELGLRFSLDDFGTAHAGLSYLRRFPFDSIKIDKSFVQDTVDQPEARAIVAAVLGIGSALGLDVVAEGVETEAQLAELRLMQCDRVQGFLTGRPTAEPDTAS